MQGVNPHRGGSTNKIAGPCAVRRVDSTPSLIVHHDIDTSGNLWFLCLFAMIGRFVNDIHWTLLCKQRLTSAPALNCGVIQIVEVFKRSSDWVFVSRMDTTQWRGLLKGSAELAEGLRVGLLTDL